MTSHDAVIVGAGPNGLAAAIVLAQAGWSVLVREAQETIGGGSRTLELTLPGFRHDPCSAIHPLAVASPFLKTLPLKEHGLELIDPPLALAHPLDDGTAATLARSIPETAASLGPDGEAWTRLMTPLVKDADHLIEDILGPLRVPHHPVALARFGLPGLRSAQGLIRSRFTGLHGAALFAGIAAHSMLRLDQWATASFGLSLGLFAHVANWPIPRGGSQAIVDAMAAHLRSLGGEVQVGQPVESIDEFAGARAILFDVTPRQVVRIAGDALSPGGESRRGVLPGWYRSQLEHYRYGPGVFKIDYALSGPVPWTAEACSRAGTVHLGGRFEEVAESERAPSSGRSQERPFVIVAQQSLFDSTRAPEGKHTLWAYCHVPSGSPVDMTEAIERQIERFAPGFRDLVLARATMAPAEVETYNANYIGGDINGGAQDIRQLFTRPAVRWDPYSTPNDRLFICSSATPPGGGVHGMCGYHAARSVLKRHS